MKQTKEISQTMKQTEEKKELTLEEAKKQMERNKIVSFLMYTIVMGYLADELAGKYITKDVKMTFNRFFDTFMKRNKHNLDQLFNMSIDEMPDRGAAFLETQQMIEMLAGRVAMLPVHAYPDIVMIIDAYVAGQVIREGDTDTEEEKPSE
jgi:hypothetical protein